jgi:hypothetical protein
MVGMSPKGTAVHVHVEGLAGLVSGRTSGATWGIPELSMSTCRAGSQTMSQTARGDAATRRVTETRSGRAVFIVGHLVAASPAGVRVRAPDSSLELINSPATMAEPLRSTRGGLRPQPATELQTIADGDVLDVPGSPRIIHTPGHTPSSVAVHVPAVDALVLGDTMTTRNVLTGVTGPKPAPFTLKSE